MSDKPKPLDYARPVPAARPRRKAFAVTTASVPVGVVLAVLCMKEMFGRRGSSLGEVARSLSTPALSVADALPYAGLVGAYVGTPALVVAQWVIAGLLLDGVRALFRRFPLP